MMHLCGIAALVALLLAGCAGPPSPPSKPSLGHIAPLPGVARNAQEMAMEQGLGDFYGAPYRSGGTSPSGVDCSGLVQALYNKAGIRLPRTVAQQYQDGTPVEPNDLRFGDVVFFNRYCQTRSRDFVLAGMFSLGSDDKACHDGIYLGGGRFIHASPSRGVSISRLDAEVWQVSYCGARRYFPGEK